MTYRPLDIILTLVVTAVIAFGAVTIITKKMASEPSVMTMEEAEQLVDQYLAEEGGHAAAGSEDGLIAHWTFEEGRGTSISDASGNDHAGILTNMAEEAAWEASTMPNASEDNLAMNFDGVDDVIIVSDAPDLQNLGPMTVMAWILPRSDSSYLFSKRDTCDGPWRLALDSQQQRLGFFKQTDDTVLHVQSEDEAVALNEWNHVAFTWDGTLKAAEGVKMYLGGEEAKYVLQQDGTGTPLSDVGCALRIGARVGPAEVFDGLMDDVRIYDRVLLQEEIRAVMTKQSAETSPLARLSEEEEATDTPEEITLEVPLAASVLEEPEEEPKTINITIQLQISDKNDEVEVTNVSVD